MPTRVEVLGDRAIGREKALRMARGFEPLHVSLALARGLVGVLSAIIQISVLPMFHPRQDLALSGTVALQLVGHDHPRHVR